MSLPSEDASLYIWILELDLSYTFAQNTQTLPLLKAVDNFIYFEKIDLSLK